MVVTVALAASIRGPNVRAAVTAVLVGSIKAARAREGAMRAPQVVPLQAHETIRFCFTLRFVRRPIFWQLLGRLD